MVTINAPDLLVILPNELGHLRALAKHAEYHETPEIEVRIPVYADHITADGQRLNFLQAELRRVADELPALLKEFIDKKDDYFESVVHAVPAIRRALDDLRLNDRARNEVLQIVQNQLGAPDTRDAEMAF